jgi:hypothetical protein
MAWAAAAFLLWNDLPQTSQGRLTGCPLIFVVGNWIVVTLTSTSTDTFLPSRPDGRPVSLILPIDSPAFGELRCRRLLGGEQGLALKMRLDGRLYFCGYSPLVSLC